MSNPNAKKSTSNRKAELLANVVEHIDIKSFDATPIVESMGKMSFTSRDLARATEIYNMMLEDKDCAVFLTLAGSTSAGGCMDAYADMVKKQHGRCDCRHRRIHRRHGLL